MIFIFKNFIPVWFLSLFVQRCPDKIAVIISDAMRYECGEELNKRISNTFKAKTTLHSAISAVPSYTALGMAALLPHNKIEYSGTDVLVDGINSASSENREKILNSFTEGKVYKFVDDFVDENLTKDKIDSLIDKIITENEIPEDSGSDEVSGEETQPASN